MGRGPAIGTPPGHALALVERHLQPARGIAGSAAFPARPRDMVGGGTMAGLARHVDLGPRRVKHVAGHVELLAQVRGVAFRALEIPVLVDARPVQRIAGLQVTPGVEVKPALAARLARTRIPRHAQRLQASAGQLDEVLLQRPHAEGVLDLEVGALSRRAFRVDVVLAVAREEGGRRCPVDQPLVREIAEHGRGVRDVHRAVVVGSLPRLRFACMAARARGSAHEGRHGHRSAGAGAGRSISGRARSA